MFRQKRKRRASWSQWSTLRAASDLALPAVQ
jgi:hypothetical protein